MMKLNSGVKKDGIRPSKLGLASIVVVALAALMSCSTVTIRLANQGNVSSPIEMKTYSIHLSDKSKWTDWAATKDLAKDTLVLEKLKVWPLNNEIQGIITITVSKSRLSADVDDEVRAADLIRDDVEKSIRSEEVGKGKYEIRGVKRYSISRNGKSLYVLTWTGRAGSWIGANARRTYFGKASLLLYFPKKPNEDRTFYIFLISDQYIPGGLLPVDLEKIWPIIDGFTLKD